MIQPKQNFKATESFATSSFTRSVRLRYGLIFLMLFSKLFISQEIFSVKISPLKKVVRCSQYI